MKVVLAEPELSSEAQLDLARKARDGEAGAHEQFVSSGLRYVILHALRLGIGGPELEDAVQDGTIALIQAINRFDPDRGVGLATFAWAWIAGAIGRYHRARPEIPFETVPARVVGSADVSSPEVDSADLLTRLPHAQRHVLMLRYGFAGPPKSRREVAAALKLSESQVRTVETQGLCSLRTAFTGTVFPSGRKPC